MKTIVSLIALCVLTRAYADLTNGLVAWYPFAGSLTNQVNPQQVASLLDGAELLSDSVATTNATSCASYDGTCPGAVNVPAPFPTATSVFTASFHVLESGLTSAAGGAYLTAGSDETSVLLLTHFWVNLSDNPEGTYYGAVNPPGPMTNEFLAPLQAPSIQSRWVHYVLVSATNAVSIYKDGIKIGVMNSPGLAISGDWFVGRHWWITGVGSIVYSERVLGNFKNLKVYSRALSDSEVRQLYEFDLGPRAIFVKAFTVDYSGLTVGSNYQTQASTDLISWTNFDGPFTATNFNYTNTNYQRIDNWGKLFFRVQGVP
jgi:hypothetical protein